VKLHLTVLGTKDKMKLENLFNQIDNDTINNLAEDYAISIPNENISFDPKWAKIVGTIDSQDVWASRGIKNHIIFAFRNNEKTIAYIIINEHPINDCYPLVRIWSSGTQKGLITALVGYVTKKQNLKLVITDKEPLTPEGMQWLVKLIQNPRGFNITDQSKNPVDIHQIQHEWQLAKNTGKPEGNTNIFIEHIIKDEQNWGTGYRKISESIKYIGDEGLE